MKKLEELNGNECQEALDKIFNGSVDYNRLVFENDSDKNIDCCGIEYKVKNKFDPTEKKRIISFSNPELMSWFYEHNIDITIPLRQLKMDYTELDETNSILFEHVMGINRVILENNLHSQDIKSADLLTITKADALNQIKKLQKELKSKI